MQYISQRGPEFADIDEIKDLLYYCKKTVAAQKEVDEYKKSKSKEKENKKNDKKENSKNEKKDSNIKNPCRKHDGKHDWKNCPENKNSPKYAGANKDEDKTESKNEKKDKDKKKSKKGENYSTEKSSNSSKSTSFKELPCDFAFSDKEEDSSVESAENFMIEKEIKNDSREAHPEVLLTLPGNNSMFATRALLDYCCSGVVAKKSFATALIHSGKYKLVTSTNATNWVTSSGGFTTTQEVVAVNAMLPSLSTKRTFTLTFSVLPDDCGSYDVIIGKEIMRKLGINIEVVNANFIWDELTIPMDNRG